MRQIKFRGKMPKTGKWIEGFYYEYQTNPVIRHEEYSDNVLWENDQPIDIETLCQFTGIKDHFGKKIFEGDILKDTDENIGVVVWIEEWSMFGTLTDEEYPDYAVKRVLALDESMFWSFPIEGDKSEVIGNIFDSPELLNPDTK